MKKSHLIRCSTFFYWELSHTKQIPRCWQRVVETTLKATPPLSWKSFFLPRFFRFLYKLLKATLKLAVELAITLAVCFWRFALWLRKILGTKFDFLLISNFSACPRMKSRIIQSHFSNKLENRSDKTLLKLLSRDSAKLQQRSLLKNKSFRYNTMERTKRCRAEKKINCQKLLWSVSKRFCKLCIKLTELPNLASGLQRKELC